ncbi:MAG: hypothetical protein JOZ22_10170 [Acidobacteriia bacterium]|nr:hypothetical protein [Terriglobia bacterium]
MNGRVLRYTRRMEIKDVLIPADQLGELKNLYRQVASDEKAKAVLKKQ